MTGVAQILLGYETLFFSLLSGRLSDGSKIAIGVSVVVLVVILVGVTLGILYRKRKQYVGHRPALVQQMDTHDDVITDNIL